jgi:hypothetical protein
MHDMKYFFLNKNNQIIQRGGEGKQIFRKEQITESITKKYYFSKFRGARAPMDKLGSTLGYNIATLKKYVVDITKHGNTQRVCLAGERISVRITLFGLVVENSMRLVISREM